MSPSRLSRALIDLAQAYGVYTEFVDCNGQQQTITVNGLLRILQLLGAPIERPAQAAEALRAFHQETWQTLIEPVVIAWDGELPPIQLRLPANAMGVMECRLDLEPGESREWTELPAQLDVQARKRLEGQTYVQRLLPVMDRLPLGYHSLTIDYDGRESRCLIIAAPSRAYEHPDLAHGRTWGVFAPAYALRSATSWGSGTFSDLQQLATWVQSQGGGIVATLPLLAAFLDEPFEPSPYSPASRLFWNEFYLDVTNIPELAHSSAARELIASAEFAAATAELRSQPLVDYKAGMAVKRRVLEALLQSLHDQPDRLAEFRSFVHSHPRLADYAQFRAVVDRRKTSWHNWPEALKNGEIAAGDYDPDVADYHAYVQWIADQQVGALARTAEAAGPGLYLDLPLGVNSDGYDVWRERSEFVIQSAAGAPPDPFFPGGQNWGFPPPHPRQMRVQGYRYLRDYLAHHLKFAGVLRIDHFMGLARLFWIPHGLEAASGGYVKYPAEELFAVYCLESQRYQAVIVGEDLGTVPPEIPEAMQRHNIHRMYVLQFSINPTGQPPVADVFAGAFASINTHDMPMFAAFWEGKDIEARRQLKILDDAGVAAAQAERAALRTTLVADLRRRGTLDAKTEPTAETVLHACLSFLARSPAPVSLITLEDVWGETEPQNTPGTWREVPNWQRKLRLSLEELRGDAALLAVLRRINTEVRAHLPQPAPSP